MIQQLVESISRRHLLTDAPSAWYSEIFISFHETALSVKKSLKISALSFAYCVTIHLVEECYWKRKLDYKETVKLQISISTNKQNPQSDNTLLKSDVTRRDHVVHCHGSQECWFTLCQFCCQFHSRRHSLRITLKSTTLVHMRSR